MKKIITLLLLPLLALTLNSCKKENKEGENNGKYTKLVKTITVEFSELDSQVDTSTISIYYDNQNRPIKINSVYSYDFSETDVIQYSKNAITLIRQRKESFIDTTITYQFLLDNNGYLISDNFGATGFASHENSYTYKNGYLKEKKEINKKGFDEYERYYEFSWKNGNMVQITTDDSKENATFTGIFEYDNRENILNSYIIFQGFTYSFLKVKGHTSKNNLVKVTGTNNYNNENNITTYDYEFDNDGYPTQIIQKSNQPEEHQKKYTITYY